MGLVKKEGGGVWLWLGGMEGGVENPLEEPFKPLAFDGVAAVVVGGGVKLGIEDAATSDFA